MMRRKLQAIRALNDERGVLGMLDQVIDESEPAPTQALSSAVPLRATLAVLVPRHDPVPVPKPESVRRPDRQLAVSGKWAVASDGMQWILQRRGGVDRRTGLSVWAAVSFVPSTKAVLARCMREKGTPAEDAARLLAGLGERFSPKIAQGPVDGSVPLRQAA
jgi:hypothetical protein